MDVHAQQEKTAVQACSSVFEGQLFVHACRHSRKEDGVHAVRVSAVELASKQPRQNVRGHGVVLDGSGLPGAGAVHVERGKLGVTSLRNHPAGRSHVIRSY